MNNLLTDLFKKTILIVDDAPEDIELLNILLANYNRKLAINGKKALEIVMSENPPDLILLDIIMPNISGLEVAKKIKENVKTKNIPIIFTTAISNIETILSGFETGAVDYVTKPYNEQEILARINTHLELKHKSELLEASNQILEKKIKERTIDLAERNKKLMNLDKAKNKFLRIISHEMRTPLNGIYGFSTILHNKLKGTEYYEYTSSLIESVDRLKEFSEIALISTEIQSLDNDIVRESTPLDYIIDIVKVKFDKKLTDKKIKLVIDYDNSFNELYINPKLFQICLNNIVKNAIEYSDKGSVISIFSSREKDYYVINITDTGKGISQSLKDFLFEPFISETKHSDQSLGMGIYISNLVMKAHNGKIELCDNSPNGLHVKLMIKS